MGTCDADVADWIQWRRTILSRLWGFHVFLSSTRIGNASLKEGQKVVVPGYLGYFPSTSKWGIEFRARFTTLRRNVFHLSLRSLVVIVTRVVFAEIFITHALCTTSCSSFKRETSSALLKTISFLKLNSKGLRKVQVIKLKAFKFQTTVSRPLSDVSGDVELVLWTRDRAKAFAFLEVQHP